ncbi:MAG: DUF2182 domain-containing protein [Actinomycetota bacterium]
MESTLTVDERQDTPRRAMSLLERNVTILVTFILVALAGIGWWSTVVRARDMNAAPAMGPSMGAMHMGSGMRMINGISDIARGGTDTMTVGVFMAMWVVMMVAMMFPTIAPMVLAHRMVVRKRGEGWLPTALFVSGYLFVWALIGLVPLGLLIAFRHIVGPSSHARWIPIVAGGVIAVAGVYQFTRWKAKCLRACRTPLSFLMTHDFRKGNRGAFKAGISHGAWCLGCCWALMAVLFVVGLMNLVWMAAISLVFLAEKNWRHGVLLTKIVGSGLVVTGIVMMAVPSLLTTLSLSSVSLTK